MLLLSDYNVYIFDCDGVILDSNKLKIDAMKNSLLQYVPDIGLVTRCTNYFSRNFGKSRFHHVEVFINEILDTPEENKEYLKSSLLTGYSNQCKELYLKANITPGFIEFILKLQGKKYVASGSEQSELREVLKKRGLDKYFEDILGSPTPKKELIRQIIAKEQCGVKAIMFGDAESDFYSANDNNIDFIFYSPFSNVKDKMLSLCESKDITVIDNYLNVNFL